MKCTKCRPGLLCNDCYDKSPAALPNPGRPNKPEDVKNHAVKFDGDKPRLELVPPSAIIALGQVLGYGAAKYSEHNYLKGMAHTRLIGAALRHMFAWIGGEEIDPESGLSHLSHALASIAMLIETKARNVGTDDRYKPQC
jgi:hypothetical protein